MKKIWVVDYKGIMDYNATSLSAALRYIGTKVKGNSFGCLQVTAADAVEAGYTIRQC